MIDRSLYSTEELALIDARICPCGCHTSVAHRKADVIYSAEGHRQRLYRRRVKAAAAAAGLPPALNLRTAKATGTTSGRNGDGDTRRRARKSGQSIRVSYRKAVEAVSGRIGPDQAAAVLDPLLTDRQRKALRG